MTSGNCTHSCFVNVTTTSDGVGSASKLAIALLGAVIAVAVRALWDLVRDRRVRRERDKLILRALLHEVSALSGSVSGLEKQMATEAEFFLQGKWSLKPFRGLTTGIYDMVKTDPPLPLIHAPYALPMLFTVQVQCEFTNALIDAQAQWKMQDGPLETIEAFHVFLHESLGRVTEKLERIEPVLAAAIIDLERPWWRHTARSPKARASA